MVLQHETHTVLEVLERSEDFIVHGNPTWGYPEGNVHVQVYHREELGNLSKALKEDPSAIKNY